MSKRKGGPADEFMKELEADKDYQEATEKRNRAAQAREEEFSRAEQPVVQALAEVGVEVSSVWDLVNSSADHPQAVEVLEQHLKDDSYPDRVREGIARSLSFSKAASAWPTLVGLYRSTTDSFDLQQGLAAALAGTVTEETIDELVTEARREDHGESRLILLHGLKRLKSRSPAAKEALEGFVDDEVLGKTASRMLS